MPFLLPCFPPIPTAHVPCKPKACWEKWRGSTSITVIIEFNDADESEGGNEFKQLTGYSWNPDLLTTGAIPSICGGLNFNNVVLFDRQQKFS